MDIVEKFTKKVVAVEEIVLKKLQKLQINETEKEID